MTSKKLGALLQSAPPATVRSAPEMAPMTAIAKIEPPRPAAISVEQEVEVPLQVLVPAHIREELGIMVAKERISLRALILRSIRSLGIEVTDQEIKGKRGRRRRP